MLMLVSCRNSFGFTLIELMVVLGLISVVAAVVFPGLFRLSESINRAIELERIVIEINSLGRRSFDAGERFELRDGSLDLPEGWKIHVTEPVTYSSRGVCRGGVISLSKGAELQLSQKLVPPFCQIDYES